MPDEQEQTRNEVLELLTKRKPVLMAGAGLSCSVGYPSWPGLINKIREHLGYGPDCQANDSLISYADKLRAFAEEQKRANDYYQLLRDTFSPRLSLTHKPFHRNLVRLGFRALSTTNYDEVIECAVNASRPPSSSSGINCRALDLCQDDPYNLWHFLRDLGAEEHSTVLHLHGYFYNPRGIILTESDYNSRYGKLDGGRNLDTIHRKVLWSLLAYHPLFFVGFSLTDDFFTKMLEIVRDDFQAGTTKCFHFGIFPAESEEKRQTNSRLLRSNGVAPLFYDNSSGTHGGLEALILELARELGREVQTDPLDIFNRTTMGL